MPPIDVATADKLLTTTRSVRARLDLTRPVESELIAQCLEIATQAPQGSSLCRYHFLVVTDATKRARLAEMYRRAFPTFYTPEQIAELRRTRPRDVVSWLFLVEHMQDVPVLIIPCVEGRPEGRVPERLSGLYGNILPATWSLMLALRARGVGAAWTTIGLTYEDEVAALLEIPKTVTAVAVLPVAYFTGDDFKPATRVPARERTYWNTWGTRR